MKNQQFYNTIYAYLAYRKVKDKVAWRSRIQRAKLSAATNILSLLTCYTTQDIEHSWTNYKSLYSCLLYIYIYNIYNMSGRVVSDIQTRAEGEWLYIWYNTAAHVVYSLMILLHLNVHVCRQYWRLKPFYLAKKSKLKFT